MHIYATSDGGKHGREVSVINDQCEMSAACLLLAPASVSSVGTAATDRWASHAPATGAVGGVTSPSRRPVTAITRASTPGVLFPQVGSMVVEVLTVLRIAATTDTGGHWDLRRLPPPAPRLIRLANFYCPTDESCLDLVSARPGWSGRAVNLYRTTDGGLSWRTSPTAPNTPWGKESNQLSLDFLSPSVSWAWYVGGSGLLWRTTDGGRYWSTYSLGRR